MINVDWFFLSHRLPIFTEAIKKKYEVHVATGITDKLGILESHGLIVHPLRIHRSRTGFFSVFSEFLQIFFIIRSVTPDIVHLVTIKPVLLGGIAARVARVPAVVSSVSGLGFIFVSRGPIAFFRRKLISFFYRFSFDHNNQRIIFQNREDQSRLTELAGISPKKSTLIRGSGVDLSLFKYIPVKGETPVVLLASRLLLDKGIREFVDAARLVNEKSLNARFVLVGAPDPLNPATIKSKELDQWKQDGMVELWGYRHDMHNVLSMANIVVLPSYREGFPKVLMEASAAGRVIVTTDVPGCRDVIQNGVTGLLVPPRNSERLAEAISVLLADTARCKEMGRAGRAWAEKTFDVQRVVAKHIEIYEELIAKTNACL